MASGNSTCGECRHGVPCREIHKSARHALMTGWLACAIKQNTPEEKARFLSPNRAACPYFDRQQEQHKERVNE